MDKELTEAFRKAIANIDRLIERLNKERDIAQEQFDSGKFHWGHVGDAGRIGVLLRIISDDPEDVDWQ